MILVNWERKGNFKQTTYHLLFLFGTVMIFSTR